MIPINKRRVGICILLSFVTFGIYQIYWEYLLVKNTRAVNKDKSSCTGEMLCLIFVPFYSLYWWFTRGESVKNRFNESKYSAAGSGAVYLILAIFGLNIISMAIMQNDFNSLSSGFEVRRHKGVSYAKWGYIFIAPFFIIYTVCSLYPQILTIYYSLFEYRRQGLTVIGPKYVGLENFQKLFEVNNSGEIGILKYAGNTFILWIMGAVPQVVVALLLAVWFTSYRLNIKGQAFFKTVIYMPNLIMASAFSMLFFTLFSNVGPINQLLQQTGILETKFDFFAHTISVRSLIALMNFLMWFGNTTIVLMAGIMGIDQSIFEAASIDGATSSKIFFKITLPLLMPILTYTVITAMIGGINMYDVPYILTNRNGNPDRTSFTLIMYMQNYLATSNYGMAGAISVLVFIFSAILSIFVYSFLVKQYKDNGHARHKDIRRGAKSK